MLHQGSQDNQVAVARATMGQCAGFVNEMLDPTGLTTHGQQKENRVGHLYTTVYNFVHLSTIQSKIMRRITFEIVVMSSLADFSSLT